MIDTSKPIHLNYPNFDTVVKKSTILVDFWAEWCGPCKAQDPVLEEVAKEMDGKALIGKVNVDDNRTLANKYGIMNIPTMILFKNGERIHQFVGVQSKERILHILNKNI
ncbi:MAG: thioredoxin [Bacteroidales bacterium]|nr:thioredoxin [Bacteroidales bacterium]